VDAFGLATKIFASCAFALHRTIAFSPVCLDRYS